ncbi:MAG: class I SAM-dependent methyltransferase [Chloroflexi bacterium]|nr:class I SAM-dependent methyltransferase [Chloroflexota bacterium]
MLIARRRKASNDEEQGHRVFAAVWERIGHSHADARKQTAGEARGRVLEIGAGTGFNFSFYGDQAERVTATDPDPFMLRRAQPRADAASVEVEVQQASAEDLPFDDASFDTVVGTWVACSFDDPAKAFSEIHRVLKPGGELRFHEHVRSENSLIAFGQDMATPLTRWLGAGCHQNRETVRYIREAGFELRQLAKVNALEVEGVAVRI